MITSTTTNKPIIAIDIDDVLAQFVPAFCVLARERWDEEVTIHNFTEEWSKMFKVNDLQTIKDRAAEMFSDFEFYNHMKPIEGASEVLLKLSNKFRLVPTTSRIVAIRDITNSWLERHFGDIFEEVVFSGAYDSDKDYSKAVHLSKGQICRRICAEFLIDDQPKHVNGAAELGIRSVLFGDYGWNRESTIHNNATRIADWGGVAKYFGVD